MLLAWGGASSFGDDDDNTEVCAGHIRRYGARCEGECRSQRSGVIVTRTDLLGTYKIPGFGKSVDPKDVDIECDKPGYKRVRVVRRSSASSDPKIPIETECILQKT
jgi:hypothetical protein